MQLEPGTFLALGRRVLNGSLMRETLKVSGTTEDLSMLVRTWILSVT